MMEETMINHSNYTWVAGVHGPAATPEAPAPGDNEAAGVYLRLCRREAFVWVIYIKKAQR